MHKYEFGDIRYLHKVKQYLSQGLSAFWPDDLDVYMRQLPPQGGAWHHRWMLKVTSCERKCTANKPEPGSAHDHRHIMTSPGHTGISHRDMQTRRVFWRHIGRTNQTTGWFLQVLDQSGRILAVTEMWASSSAVIPRRLRDTQFARERCSCARNATTMTASTTFRWVSAKKT